MCIRDRNFASQLMVQPGLYLLESDFGWVIAGRMDQLRTQSTTALLAITQTLESLWTLDTLGIREPNLSEEQEEEITLDLFYKNITFDKKER